MTEDDVGAQQPLKGAVLCSTALSQDVKAKVGNTGTEMGAVHNLDLTSDVTHLLVGNVDSEKYRHVAKRRPDILVLRPEWLFAVRDAWTQGDEVDLEYLNEKYRLPTFHSLNICVTGFFEAEQRKWLEDNTRNNGAEYHGDLTKAVTHLVAAKPTGAKYDRAKQWNIKVVSLQWFKRSLERGMILDESAFDPLIEHDRQGEGAFEPQQRNVTTTKRPRGDDAKGDNSRRKMRRTASQRLNSQSQSMWQDITTTDNESSLVEDAWSQGFEVKREEPEPTLIAPPLRKTISESHLRNSVSRTHSHETKGLFSGWVCLLHGHNDRITGLLRKLLTENEATIVEDAAGLEASEHDWSAIILPSTWVGKEVSLPPLPAATKEVTEWWVERCIKLKRIIDPAKDPFCQALYEVPSDCFQGRIISASGFGDDVRYIAKVIEAAGGKYEETVSRSLNLLIFNYTKDLDKPAYCAERNIDVVTPQWLFASLEQHEAQPAYPYMLPDEVCEAIRQIVNSRRKSNEGHGGRGDAKADMKKQAAQRLSGVGKKRPTSALPLGKSITMTTAAPRAPASNTDRSTPLEEVTKRSQERSNSQPLRLGGDLLPVTNAETQDKTETQDKENSISIASHNTDREQPPKVDTRQVTRQTSELLSGLMARRQNSSSAPADGLRQKRTLGRAPSANTASSFAAQSAASPFLEEEADDEEPQPSQQLSYDAPGAEEYRKMMGKKMGTKFDEHKLKLGTVRDIVNTVSAGIGSRVRGRNKDVR